jgi:aminoglycoside phosphotransferase
VTGADLAPHVLQAVFDEAGVAQAEFTFTPKPGPPTPLRSYFSADQVLTIAVDDEGRRLNLVESRCRGWASAHEIPVPTVHAAASDGQWLLAERVQAQAPQGATFVHAALDVADRIATLSPPDLDVPASGWRSDDDTRADLLRRLVRAVAGRLPLHRFVAARRASAALTDVATCHGDFYRRNVLSRGSALVAIIDWEFVGPAPRFTDHVRFWSTLRRAEDREVAWQRLTSGLSADERRHLATLTEWLALRLLAENLAAPRSQRDPQDVAHARTVVREARRLTSALR